MHPDHTNPESLTHEDIERQTAEFLAKGNRIDERPENEGTTPGGFFHTPVSSRSEHIRRRARKRNTAIDRAALEHNGKGILSNTKSGYYGIYPINRGRQFNVFWRSEKLGTAQSIEEALRRQHNHIKQLIKEGKIHAS